MDGHGVFDVDRAARGAARLEPYALAWYEEPVAPTLVDETVEIGGRIASPMAGGELPVGLPGFAGIIRRRAFDVIMPGATLDERVVRARAI